MWITAKGAFGDLLKMNVFITGVTSGLGKELAKEFISKGYSVWGVGRTNLGSTEDKFHYSVCDVSKLEDVKRVYEEMKNKKFIPDMIILNAGIIRNDLTPEFSYSIFREMFNINLFGAVNWIDVFLSVFLKRKKGIFVAISSLSAYRPLVINKISYPSSKAALSMVFQAFRIQFASSALRFITFHIGPMQEKQTLFQITYQKAAEKIVKYLHLNRKADVIDFPFIPTVITKISKFFSDAFISRKVLRIMNL